MCDCVSSTPLVFSVPQVQVPKSGLTPLTRYPSITTITHCSAFRNCRFNLVSTKVSRKSRVLGSEESESRGELGFKEKSQEPLELDSRLQNDSTGLDILELKGEKRSGESEEEDFVRVRDSNEIEESKQLKAKARLRRGRQMIRRPNILAKQVISIQSALSLGFVSQIWVDTNSWMVLIVEVRLNLLSGESERFLLEDVEQVGDVVLVENENVLDNELKMVGLETLVGYRVVTPGQQYIGKKVQSPLTGDHKIRPKSGRTPLQPKNSPATPITEIQILKPKPKQQDWIEISVVGESNKENNPIYVTTPKKLIIEALDVSLAEELSAIRNKLERLKAEREKIEKMLNERDRILNLQMKELEQRGEIQKRLEIEVDRLYRLKELQSFGSMRISPLRSLREKEHEKKISQVPWQEMKGEETEESSITKSGLQSPCLSLSSSSSINSISSQLVTVK